MKRITILLIFLLSMSIMATSQNAENQNYKSAFQTAYQACPDIPQGLLEAISFTNTHCNHLTDANYFHDGPDAMPRAYGLMGLVKDGKGYFRENLHLVSELSGISEAEILESPEKNVLAYAKAFERLAKESKDHEIKGYLSVIQQLSELPIGKEKDVYPMQSMLYSVCTFLNNAKKAEQYGFPKYQIDLKAVFRDHYNLLSAEGLQVTRGSDYPQAIWDPAPECNFSDRTSAVSAVAIHYTEGSYAGCISWFKNCDASVSAHYVIRSSDGQVTQMVREADKAWHARTANPYTIGIEHEAYGNIWSFFTEEMYQSSADLVRNICSRYAAIDGHRTFYRDTLDNGTCLNNGVHDLGGETACTKIRGHQHFPDQSHTDPGPYWDWNYYYKLINEGTAVTMLEGSEGRFDHRNYGDDERKIWVIRGPEESTIQLDFSSFDLEANYDFLWIYDGDDVYAPKIGRWNTKNPGTVQASSNVMCVEFRSDCATTGTGWEASWKAVMPGPIEPEEPEIAEGVYPNPTDGVFTVKSDRTGFTDVVVYDVYGNKMFQDRFVGTKDIDASGWADGVYMVNFGKPIKMGNVVKLVKVSSPR
ncbi:MAG: N-acetylmuramoyl-L-alanine amidase [Bacteroidales bacterium]|nr:N-acetylmuramoyl-L-alanine amidase [Bacteroidales bacterium]